MSELKTHLFSCLSDNYGVLVHDSETGDTASIDVPEEGAVRQALADTGWILTHVFVTHHHWDHIGGLEALNGDGVTIIGPAKDAHRIDGLDQTVGEGDTFRFGNHDVTVFETPGHTSGHVSYWIPSAELLFAGDTLFAMGCGRLFEGTPADMWRSLSKLGGLPASTRVYCGHEYTLSNARFAVTADPDNTVLAERLKTVEELRARGEPTIPSTIGQERATNPFMRAGDPGVAAAVGLAGASPEQVLAEVRARKDAF